MKHFLKGIMRRNTTLAITIATVFSVAALAQAQPKGPQKVTTVEGITEYAYPNGFRVLLFPDASKPKVTVNITYLVGSRNEGYGETGMAHLLEHLMFKQTKTRADIKQELTAHGADPNGSTSWDRTNYYETLNASDENLRWALGLEADRMVNTKMEKAILDTEMTVVRNEFESGENSPSRTLMQRALEAAFTWHNYGHLPIGNRSDIEHVPIDRLAAFYQKYYQPDDAILAVAGKFDEAKTLGWITEYFAGLPRPQRVLSQPYTLEPTQDGERSVTLRRVGDVQGVVAIYHVPAATHPDAAALDVLSGVLGEAPAGRLYKALVEAKKAVSASADSSTMHDPGFFMASAQMRQDQSLEDAKQTLIKTLEGLASQPPTKEEVERVKTRNLKQLELAMTDSETICMYLSETAAVGDWRLLFLGRERLKAVTEKDVARVAAAYLKPSNRTLAEFIPTKEPDRAVIPEAPEITTLFKDFKGGAAVAEGEVFDPTPANVEGRVTRSKLAGGMKVVLLPKKTRGGVVVARVTLRFGDEKSLMGKSAAAQMAGALLMRGTKTHTRQQIQDEMDKLKAQISVSGGATNATATVQTVEANLAGALRLAAEILREPAFPEKEFDELRQQRLAAAEQSRSEPQALGQIELQRRLMPYPRGDVRYVSTPDEQIEDLKKLTLDEARKFHEQFYGASTGEFSAVGQFDKAEIQKLAGELFGSWKSPSAYTRVLSSYRKIEPSNQKIETPDKQMAMFLIGGRVKLTDDDPDFAAMTLANYMVGGGSLSNRLFKRIRDKEGLSYGVQSVFQAPGKDDGALFVALAICAPQNAPKVEASMIDELSRTAKDGFAADEVAAAKKSWAQEQSVERSRDGSLAGVLASREFLDRTMKFDETLEARVAALTPEQVSAAFRKLVDPAALTIVKAGDFKKAGVYQQ
jgi:zinc protease